MISCRMFAKTRNFSLFFSLLSSLLFFLLHEGKLDSAVSFQLMGFPFSFVLRFFFFCLWTRSIVIGSQKVSTKFPSIILFFFLRPFLVTLRARALERKRLTTRPGARLSQSRAGGQGPTDRPTDRQSGGVESRSTRLDARCYPRLLSVTFSWQYHQGCCHCHFQSLTLALKLAVTVNSNRTWT